jgi:hypothetical protein
VSEAERFIVSKVERFIVSEVERLRVDRSSGGDTAGFEPVETAGRLLNKSRTLSLSQQPKALGRSKQPSNDGYYENRTK